MRVMLSYLGQSKLQENADGKSVTMSLKPNLAREPVAFDAALKQPLRFREAMSALHDVVVSDQGFKPRDKTAYETWKKSEAERLATIRRETFREAKKDALAARGVEIPPGLQSRYNKLRTRYWDVRQQYSNYLMKNDSALWRMLMPCDPVITVAEDVVFFECFSADESSYGCLSVSRSDGFGSPTNSVKLGTTNVDYSWELYRHFQSLRSYRETRFRIDPAGFEVVTKRESAAAIGDGDAKLREEKIDLPDGWLRGFMQVQAAMGMPMQTVTLPRETMYSLLAYYKTHRARTSPRALRFELLPGKAPTLVLEPWEQRIEVTGTPALIYDGPPTEPIRIWGTRRLLVLARLLPLIDSVEVHLLGTGLPSFWVAKMGEMRLTLGLSGWTSNDWTRGSAVDLLLPPVTPTRELISQVSRLLQERRAMTLPELRSATTQDLSMLLAVLRHLAHAGQVISDLGAGVYRWRQVMPLALGEAEMGPEHPELTASRNVRVGPLKRETLAAGSLCSAMIDGMNKPVEAIIDVEGRLKRATCSCSWHYRFGMKKGPCRHLLALRDAALGGSNHQTQAWRDHWYDRLRRNVR